MTMQAIAATGKILAWEDGKLMGACGCCATPPPECVHFTVTDLDDLLICEADLLLTDTPRNPGAVEWNCEGLEPGQDHYIIWTCQNGTIGYFAFNVAYYRFGYWTRFGVNLAGTYSYCDGPPTDTVTAFDHKLQVSACEVPGRGRPKRHCPNCRGL